jgi:hypothetical protein
MDRFSIIKNKYLKVPIPKSIETFGFDDTLEGVSFRVDDTLEGVSFRVPAPYWPPTEELNRVGIIFKDPNHIFVGTNIHYYNGVFFLCKSTKFNRAICCSVINPAWNQQRPYFYRKIVCPIVIYHNQILPTPYTDWSKRGIKNYKYEIAPWIFTNSTFKDINTLNNLSPINSNDFLLKRRDVRAKAWDINSCPDSNNLWQDDPTIKEQVLRASTVIFKNLKNYLGQDLNDLQIKSLLSERPRNSSKLKFVNRNHYIERTIIGPENYSNQDTNIGEVQ